MQKILLITFLLLFGSLRAQTYFPPLIGSTWDTISPSSLGWCQDSIQKMYNWLETSNSKAFIVLKDGKIVLEKYFGTFTVDSFHVWNSAGKTLTAYAVGIAQKEGFLNINDPTSNYLGTGWTSCTPTQEQAITIRNQLTMTSGLDDITDFYCTDPACLTYVADAGTRWAYHNAPYTLLDSVIESATGTDLNTWVYQKIGSKIGMTGLYVQSGYNTIFVSKPRAMARFGLLLSQNGYWNGTEVLNDPTYLNAMRTPSQNLNNSYGYLTWLNGQSSFMLPQSQFVFNGSICPNAPSDMYAALGKDGQIINVVPSTGIVFIRMGADMGNSLVGSQYNDTLWQYMNHLSCTNALTANTTHSIQIKENPSTHFIELIGLNGDEQICVYSALGEEITVNWNNQKADISQLKNGTYLIRINNTDKTLTLRFVKN